MTKTISATEIRERIQTPGEKEFDLHQNNFGPLP